LTSITPPSGAAIGATPSLAEAVTVMVSEASSAATIRTKRLIWFFSHRVIAIGHNFPMNGFVPPGQNEILSAIFEHRMPLIPAVRCRRSPIEEHPHHRCFDPGSRRSTERTRNGSGESAMGSNSGLALSWQKLGTSGNLLHVRFAGELND
jgi:hypothetical protein